MIGAMIKLKNGKVSLEVREGKLEFNLGHAMYSLILEDACYRFDILERLLSDEMPFLKS